MRHFETSTVYDLRTGHPWNFTVNGSQPTILAQGAPMLAEDALVCRLNTELPKIDRHPALLSSRPSNPT